MRNLIVFSISLLILSCTAQELETNKKRSLRGRAEIPYLKGESIKAFDSKPLFALDDNKWFTNDHCLIEDKDGALHWFGINNPYPPEGKSLYRYHPYLGHLKSTDPIKEWERLPMAIDEANGTEYVGAPFVVWYEESERWVMVLETFLDGNRRMEVAWSDDLYNWERTYKAILPETLWMTSRDPHITKGKDGKYWIHLVSVDNSVTPSLSQVVRLKTKDFVNFEGAQPIMSIADGVSWSGIESPFLIERNGLWYLFFTYAHRRYTETIVVVSDDPEQFDYESNTLTTLFGHAMEIFSYQGKDYATSCGPEDQHYLNHQSMSIAELGWLKQSQ